MMNRVLRVLRREYLAYVKTRSFLITTLGFPITILLAVGIPLLLESMPSPPREFTIIDNTGQYLPDLVDIMIEKHGAEGMITLEMEKFLYAPLQQIPLPPDPSQHLSVLQEMINESRLFACFVISENNETGNVTVNYYAANLTESGLLAAFSNTIDHLYVQNRLLPLVGDEQMLTKTMAGVPVTRHAITDEGEEEATIVHVVRSYAPMGFVYLLWIAVMSMASQMMTSTIEEKSNRVIEVLVSSVSSFEYMLGKLLGLAAAGLTVVFSWILSIVLIFVVIQNQTVSEIGTGLGGIFTPLTIFWFVTFFLLGYLFFSSIYVGIGSVCNTVREASSLIQPVVYVMIVPLILMAHITNNPNSIVAVIASFIPPLTPFIMMNRIPATPPPPFWQVALAAVILAVATYGSVMAAAKVFRIGILMYGKPPSLREIVRWARQGS